jgi:hypothetical protein
MAFEVVGLGNALMDALVLLEDDELISTCGLDKGIMHPVDDARWKEVYSNVDEGKVSLQTGGSCANTIATLGLMVAKVSYCGQVGNDKFGDVYTKQMQEACGHNSLVHADGATGKCLSLVSSDAERTMITDLGIAVGLESVSHFSEAIAESKLLYLTGYLFLGDPMKSRSMEAIAIAEAAKVPVALDVADPFVVDLTKDLMLDVIEKHVDIVFLNEEEARAMTGSDPAGAIEQLKSICDTVVVKMGSKGSMVYSNGKLETAGIHSVKAIDTTGAGDSYAAGFLYGWVQGWDLNKSAVLGSRIAAETVSQLGAVVRDRALLKRAIDDVE